MTNKFVVDDFNASQTPDLADSNLDELDYLLAKEEPFAYTSSEVAELLFIQIRNAVAWHLHPNSSYAGYAERQGFSLDQLQTEGDLVHVPLLPSMLFKRPGLAVAHPGISGYAQTTSSGTKGSVSIIPRDDLTLRRFFSSIGNLSNELLDIQNPDIQVFNLGPDADEAKHLWISYVMAGTTILLPKIRHYVSDGVYLIERLLSDLQAVQGERIALIGPPSLLLDLAHVIKKRRLTLKIRCDSLVISIGGWKKRSGEKVVREFFDAELSSALSLPVEQIRDSFNMVELNTVLLECEHKNLHIPPWLSVIARDPADLSVKAEGNPGVLGYLDPTANSYPGFILSDDIGVVFKAVDCKCGRCSDVLKIIRRLNTMEARGCALKLDSVSLA
jgi:long-chain-fatty-acid---luciferin-component ligase